MQNQTPLVSILCTAYNHEEYLRSALDSFVSQETSFAFEVLVNDDASTDGTADIIREYAEKYPHIIRPFLQEKNLYSQGVDIYLNIFYPNARGKYFAYCEGDDYWTDNTKLQQQVDFLEKNPGYVACVHDSILHYCNGQKPDALLIGCKEDKDLDFETVIHGTIYSYHTSSILARGEVIRRTPDYYFEATSHGFADYAWALILKSAGNIRFLAKPMSVYRFYSNPASWSSGVDFQYRRLKNFITGKRNMLRAFLAHVPEEHKPQVEKELIEKEFELMYIEGRDREQRREPYRSLLRQQPMSYQLKNFLKCYVPGLQRYYRKKQGYEDY